MKSKRFIFYIKKNRNFFKLEYHALKIKQLEKLNRTKTDSGNWVENTKMWNNSIEGTRQINSVT